MNESSRKFQQVMEIAGKMHRSLDVIEKGLVHVDAELLATLVTNTESLTELLPELRETQRQAIECNHIEGAKQAENIITAIQTTRARVGRIERAAEVQETVH